MKRLILILCVGLFISGSVRAVDKAVLRWARNKPRIDSIQVDGLQSFSSGDIKKRLYSRKRTIWLAIKGDRRSKVQRETLGRDTLEVKYLYLSNGFLNVQVNHAYVPLNDLKSYPKSSAIVRLEITEGTQYRYGNKDLSGDFDDHYRSDLQRMIDQLKNGAPVNIFQLKAVEADLKAFWANRGYPYARITYQVDTTGSAQACPVHFDIASDSLVHFGEVSVSGAEKYPEYCGRRELKIEPGAIYRRDDIVESQRRLFESGYFSTFQLRQADDSPDRLNPNFALSLRERKAKHLTFRTGAGQSAVRDLQWDISALFGKRNFFGSRKYDLLVDYTFSAGRDRQLLGNRYRARYTEPWFLGIRMPLSLAFEWQPRLKDAEQNFDKRVWLVSANLTKWFGRKLRTSLGTEYQNVKISGITEDSIAVIRRLRGISARRKIFFSLRRDSRDDLFIPSRGSVSELSGDFYGGFLGGDENFFKLHASWSRYRLVWPGWTAASRIRLGWAEAFKETVAVPLDEAIYLGGASTVRGFEQNKLGPLREDGTPEGGRYTFVFNQEFRWRTVQVLNVVPFIGDLMERFPLWQSLFVDVGNAFPNKAAIRPDNLAVAYGTGLQVVSPAGPIRIDYARVLEHHDFDFAYRWHFTILYAF